MEEGELSEDQEFGESEQLTSEEQTYRETMSGIRSFMGWSHVPDVDSSNSSDDNPFAGPKAPVPNKVSVQMPTEEWLCKKLNKLNLILIEGYPSRTAEAGHRISGADSIPDNRLILLLQFQAGTLVPLSLIAVLGGYLERLA